MNVECKCTEPGYCERHKILKSDRMLELCKEGGRYWDHWEKGPKQTKEKAGLFSSGKVGFVGYAYNSLGGAEVWHQTLLPALKDDLVGFAVSNPQLATGDFSKLGCPHGIGTEAVRELCIKSEVIVCWGLGKHLPTIIKTIPKKKRPAIISVSHCGDQNEWTVKLMRNQKSCTDLVVYLCPSGAKTCPAGIPAKMIPNGIDPSRAKRTTTSLREIKARYGILDGDIVITTISRLSPEKRIGLIIEAMKYLPSNYKFLIAGNAKGGVPAHEDELKLAAKQIPEANITFLGAIDHPGDLLAVSDAYVTTTQYEGFGLSIGEALYARVPVIAPRTGLLELNPEFATIIPHDVTSEYLTATIREVCERPLLNSHRCSTAHHGVRTSTQFIADWRQTIHQVVQEGPRAALTVPETRSGSGKGKSKKCCQEAAQDVSGAPEPKQLTKKQREDAAKHREATCRACPHFDESGRCLKCREKYPQRPCDVEVAWTTPRIKCPLNYFLALEIRCPKCRKHIVDLRGVSSCPHCDWQGDPLQQLPKGVNYGA